MANQTYGNNIVPNTPYWLSSTGVNAVFFNKLSAPPLALLDKGVLYELDDGILYYNGSAIAPIAIGNVTGPDSSYDSAIVLYDGITGKIIKNSNAIVTVNDTDGSELTSCKQRTGTGEFQIWGYNNSRAAGFGLGSSLNDSALSTGDIFGSIFLGYEAGMSIADGECEVNTVVGSLNCINLVNGDGNTSIGGLAMTTASNCTSNTAVGYASLAGLVDGNHNNCFGFGAGSQYNGSESDNICIDNEGVTGDNDTIRIGTNQTSCYIQGIYENTPVSSIEMVTIGSDGQMGSQAIPTTSFFWSGTAILTGSNSNIVPGFMSSVVFDSGSEAYVWIVPATCSVSKFNFAFSRAINVVEVINCRLLVNNNPVLLLGLGAWGSDFNSATPQVGSTNNGPVTLNAGDLVCILINAYTSAGNFYMNWTLS